MAPFSSSTAVLLALCSAACLHTLADAADATAMYADGPDLVIETKGDVVLNTRKVSEMATGTDIAAAKAEMGAALEEKIAAALAGDVITKLQKQMDAMAVTMGDQKTLIDGLSENCAKKAEVAETYATTKAVEATYITADEAVLLNKAAKDEVATALEDLAEKDVVASVKGMKLLHAENGEYTGDIHITSDAELFALAPLLDHLTSISGQLQIQSLRSLPSLGNGLFGNLKYVGGEVQINSCPGLKTLGTAFPVLEEIGGMLKVESHDNLETAADAFPKLAKVKGAVRISGNHKMETLGTSFKLLTTIGGAFQVYSNNKHTEGIKKSFASLNSIAGIDMNEGGKFNPATEVYVGSIYCNPLSNNNFGSVDKLATALKDIKLITGGLQVQQQLASFTKFPTGFAQKLQVVTGQVYLYQNKGVKSYDGLFPALGSVGGLSINGHPELTTLGSAFKNLEIVAAAEKNSNANFYFNSNQAMQSLANVFPKLRHIDGKLQLDQLKQVTNADGAFPALTSTKGKVELAYLYKLQSASIIKMFPKLEQSAGVKIDRVGKEVVIVGGEPGICNLQHYDGIFPKLKTITRDSNGWGDGGVELKNDECSTRLGSAFPALETIDGGIFLDQMEKLTSVDGAFPLLKSITKNFKFQNNRYLTNLNGAFKSLKTVGQQLYFYGNGRRSCESDWRQCSTLQTFCDSTKAFLCPLTPIWQNSGWDHDADDCCIRYCESSSAC